MNQNGQIVYFVLDYLIETKNFFWNIKIAIKSRGYEMKKGTNNLLVHIGFIGTLSNNSTTNFRIE